MFKTLYKTTTVGKVQQWQVEVDGNKFRTISGQKDGKLVTSNWTVCTGKNIGKANETSPEEQAQAEALALYTKKLGKDYYDNLSDITSAKIFIPMLAKNWEDYKDKIVYPVYSQPKLDGVRCNVFPDKMLSRNGKPFVSVPHILDSLEDVLKIHPILDGELYCDKYSSDFNAIISAVRQTKPTLEDLEIAKEIKYHIYDLPCVSGTFSERLAALETLTLPDTCVKVETTLVYNEQELMELYDKYLEAGYEGQIIRLDEPYENKRSKSLLKHKTFIDSEFEILGFNEGKGNRAGMAITATCLYEGKEFYPTLKGGVDFYTEVWNNQERYLGKTATVKYFGLTPAGVPRFPNVVVIGRDDYE